METLIHADIFFFVTTIAVVFLGIGLSIGIVYVIRILRDMKCISSKFKEESDHIIDDIDLLRSRVKQEGFRLIDIGHFFKSLFKKRSSRGKK